MTSWTSCVSPLKPLSQSDDARTKSYALPAHNPLHRELLVKQVECESEEIAEKTMESRRTEFRYVHPNICSCLKIVKEEKKGGGCYVYIIRPWLAKSLEQEIQTLLQLSSHYPESDLRRLAGELISMFTFLQEKVNFIQNVTHRGIKPQNILLDADGSGKICDFEFAKVIDVEKPSVHTLNGTCLCYSPALRAALINGEGDSSKVQHNVFKSDVYSLGVCLLNATVVVLPDFITDLRNLQQKINEYLDSIEGYSKEWVDLLRRMLTVNEELRPDFLALSRSLERLIQYGDDEVIQIRDSGIPLQVIVKCGLDHIRVSRSKSEEVPCMITVKAISLPTSAYPSTDIVAVVDGTRGIRESQMALERRTLAQVIEALDCGSRLSIISCSGRAMRMCPLLCCSPAGKQQLKEIAEGLRIGDGEEFLPGFLVGMEVLEQRRMKNAKTTVLLFSSGQSIQDPEPFIACLNRLEEQTASRIAIDSFDCGVAADFSSLEVLSNASNGVYSHIRAGQDIESRIALANGYSSVIARDLRIQVCVNPNEVKCSIPLIYSDSGGDFLLPEITANQQENFLFTLRADCQMLANPIRFDPVSVDVTYTDYENCEYQQLVHMTAKFVLWSDTTVPHNAEVYACWYRMQGLYCLQEARRLKRELSFREAEECLRRGIESLQPNRFERNACVATIRDLEKERKLLQNLMGAAS